MKSERLSPEDLEQQRLVLAENLRKNPADKKTAKAYAQFMRQYILPAMRQEAKPYSFQEYFALALEQATRALQEGNYAIGAVYVYRANGIEYVIGGRNTTVLEKSTHPHAEEKTIDLAEKLDRGENIGKEYVLLKRPAPHGKKEKILLSSLEPCIGCLRRITTHKPDAVLIATPDVTAGAMLPPRDKMLPPFWQTRVEKRGINVITPSDDPLSLNYVDPTYRNTALEMFETTQKYIDQTIHGMNENPQTFLATARRSQRKIFRKVF